MLPSLKVLFLQANLTKCEVTYHKIVPVVIKEIIIGISQHFYVITLHTVEIHLLMEVLEVPSSSLS